jgi:hypothetical protein
MKMIVVHARTHHQSLFHTKVRRKFTACFVEDLVRCFLFVVVVAGCWLPSSKVEAVGTLRAAHSPYLYAGDSYPVIEYIVSHIPTKGSVREEKTVPSFLNATDPGYRIVEFYSSRFDPTSARLRESYIQLAYTISEIATQQHSNITIDAYAVCCTTVPTICEQHGITMDYQGNVPTFMVYAPGSAKGKTLHKLNVTTIFNAMSIPIDLSTIDAATYNDVQIDVMELSTGKNHRMRTVDDLKADIHLSFDTLLRNHTFLDHDEHGKVLPLSNEKRTALKNYFLLIQKTVPPSWQIHEIVKQLINSFMYICKNKAYLLAILDTHQPNHTDYSFACQMGKTHVSGLTCGTWELIHTITVGVVEHNKMTLYMVEGSTHPHNSNDDNYRHETISLEGTLSVLRDYVHYFGLGDDALERQHLVQQLDICQEQKCLQVNKISAMVSEWIKLPLYVSKTHTDITIKMQHDQAKKDGKVIPSFQQHMSAMWPPKHYCPKCWDDHGKWNNDVVYKYMQLEYTDLNEWSLSTPEIRQELLGTNTGSALDQRQLFSILQNSQYRSGRAFHDSIPLTMQKLAIIFSSFGILIYRLISYQQKQQQRHQQSMLLLPHTMRTQINRNKSLNKSTWASYIIDQKKS